jgi:hypothetical protein
MATKTSKYETLVIDAQCTDADGVFHRVINQHDVPKRGGTGRAYVEAAFKRVVDERYSQGKPGPLAVKVFTVVNPNGRSLKLPPTDDAGNFIGAKLVDSADKLTPEDYMKIQDNAEREGAQLRALKRAGVI